MTVATPLKMLRFMESLVLVVLALATLGSFIPSIPGLGELGPSLISPYGPWVTILLIAGAVVNFHRMRKTSDKRSFIILALAVFAAIGSSFIQAKQVGVARDNGVSVDFAQTLLPQSQKDDHLPRLIFAYGAYEGASLPLEIYRPASEREGALAPVLVYIHGGGWAAQTLRQREADYRWFTDRGYVVISLEYSLSSQERHLWNIVQPQLGCALAWVGMNAARFGGDVSRLALWGESAGGNLVLNVSYMANNGTLEPSCAGTLPQIAATVSLYPVVDLARAYRNDDVIIGRFGKMMAIGYAGGSPEEVPERYAYVSSSNHISAAAPPTLLIVPESDHLVAPDAAYAFATQARSAGVDMRLIRMPYAEHAFDLTVGSIGNQLVRQATLHFLEEHGLKP